jgi:hypothetical protein
MLLSFQFEKSGKVFKEEQFANKYSILFTLIRLKFDRSIDVSEKHEENI